MDQLPLVVFLTGLIAATLRVATPLLYGTIGEIFSERAGVLNLGIEGIMFLGAFVGFAVAARAEAAGISGYLWLGLGGAVLAGVIMALLMALLAVYLGLNQHVSGLGITLLATALSLFGFRMVFGERPVLPRVDPFPQLSPLGEAPILGPIFSQYLLTYIAFLALVPLSWWVLYRTNFGLAIRSVGENPEAADAAGINVYRVRTIALVVGGALMAVGGAFLSLAQLGSFSPGIVAGRGWVCIALVIFARWDPLRGMVGALLFGGLFALQLRLQTMGFRLPYEVLLALPYLVTILALAIAGRNAAYPGAYLKPYRRE
ncbi:MAG: ABC transporter permease [Caldilineales bacterium]|nr:ABC transporter permease [Caldilineales bacterium]MDW8317321.1 ABC transporter permease [Anaerolineae bacterium]